MVCDVEGVDPFGLRDFAPSAMGGALGSLRAVGRGPVTLKWTVVWSYHMSSVVWLYLM